MKVDTYTTTVAAERAPENRCVAVVDGKGFVTSLRVLSANEPSLPFFKFMRDQQRIAVPLTREEIVMPPEWPTDTSGRALTVLEMERMGTTPTTENV